MTPPAERFQVAPNDAIFRQIQRPRLRGALVAVVAVCGFVEVVAAFARIPLPARTILAFLALPLIVLGILIYRIMQERVTAIEISDQGLSLFGTRGTLVFPWHEGTKISLFDFSPGAPAPSSRIPCGLQVRPSSGRRPTLAGITSEAFAATLAMAKLIGARVDSHSEPGVAVFEIEGLPHPSSRSRAEPRSNLNP